jgi:hypothetical protein
MKMVARQYFTEILIFNKVLYTSSLFSFDVDSDIIRFNFNVSESCKEGVQISNHENFVQIHCHGTVDFEVLTSWKYRMSDLRKMYYFVLFRRLFGLLFPLPQELLPTISY